MLENIMDEGYILSNKYRKVIFEAIATGETSITFIAKKHRIIRAVANKVINDFEQNKLIENKNNRVSLTDKGKKLAETLID